jgi:peptidoglycan-N-acetylglucosamine deacetylase
MEDKRLSEKRIKPKSKVRIIAVVVFVCTIICTLTIALKNYKMKNNESSIGNAKPSVEGVKVSRNNDMDKREATVPQGLNMDDHINQLGNVGQKIAYLTFDDGPSYNVTPKILDILDQYNIKATFFVIGKMVLTNKDILLREKNDGQAIGDYTFTHDYKYEHEKPQNLVDDFNKGADTIKSILGKDYIVKSEGYIFKTLQ